MILKLLHLNDISTFENLFNLISANISIYINETLFNMESCEQCPLYLCCLDDYNETLNEYNNYRYYKKCSTVNYNENNICEICGNHYFLTDKSNPDSYFLCADRNQQNQATEPPLTSKETDTVFYTEYNTKNYEYYIDLEIDLDIDYKSNKTGAINITELLSKQILELFKVFNLSDVLNGKDVTSIFDDGNNDGNTTITLTTPENQRNQENENVSTINLKECESDLRTYWNLSEKDTLIIMKLDKEITGMKIPKIEYEIYYINEAGEYIKLDLSPISGCEVDISVPVKLDDDIEKYDPTSEYFTSICSKGTSDSGTDIIQSDRKQEFIDNNDTLCEEGCTLSSYNKTSGKVKCSCDIKISLPLVEDIKFDKNKLKDSIVDIKNIMNIEIVKCYKNVFDSSIKKNYGFFIFISITTLFGVCAAVFLYTGKGFIINNISQIVNAKIKLDGGNKPEQKKKYCCY